MKKTFNFTLRKSCHKFYRSNNGGAICSSWLYSLFDLYDRPKEISVVVSTRSMPDSYYVKVDGEGLIITLSNFNTVFAGTIPSLNVLLSTLPDSFYVSVIA